jgi:hypothetical protein
MTTALFSFLILITTSVSADVPHLIRYQGKITDKQGAPLNGAYNITFRLYNAETGGTLLWSETQPSIPVNNGIFTVLLGNVTSLNLPFDEPYWLSMEINEDGEMEPRQAITSVGYAIHAETAERFLEGSVVPQGAIILWTGSSCPTGYSRVSALDGKFVVGGSTYNPNAGGSNTQTHSIPNHSHSFSVNSGMSTSPGYYNAWNAPPGTGPNRGQTAAENSQHTHTISGTTSSWSGTTGSADNRPEFATVIFCQKD